MAQLLTSIKPDCDKSCGSIYEMLQFMKEQGEKHRHTSHVVCAIQYSRHAYTPIKNASQTVYTTIDGTTVFKDSVPIDECRTFSNAHYGALGGSHGGVEGKSIAGEVRKMYYQWYKQHMFPEAVEEKLTDDIPVDGLFQRPDPIKAYHSFCGN